MTGNEITKVEGLEGLHDLRELVLDRNKIKIISEYAFANQWNLQELHMEENRLREVAPLGCLENLQRLYLGSNRIQVSLLTEMDLFFPNGQLPGQIYEEDEINVPMALSVFRDGTNVDFHALYLLSFGPRDSFDLTLNKYF